MQIPWCPYTHYLGMGYDHNGTAAYNDWNFCDQTATGTVNRFAYIVIVRGKSEPLLFLIAVKLWMPLQSFTFAKMNVTAMNIDSRNFEVFIWYTFVPQG